MTDTRKAAWTPDLDVYAEMLREQGVWADGCSVMTCGATTGHSVRPLAFCDSNATAQVLAAAMAPVAIMAAAAPALAEALEKAAEWFEQYAAEHYAKAKNAPSSGDQHGREVKGKLNRERANELRAALALARGAA